MQIRIASRTTLFAAVTATAAAVKTAAAAATTSAAAARTAAAAATRQPITSRLELVRIGADRALNIGYES